VTTVPLHVAVASARVPGQVHRIGEAARLIGASPSALRLWERQGLVQPARTAGGYRIYADRDMARLRRIRAMRAESVSAPGIRRLLGGGAPTPSQGRAAIDGHRLRALRTERGFSLREAAALAKLSPGFLSALERNAASASVASLQLLTHAYGVTTLDLFAAPSRSGRRIRPRERPVLELNGVRIEQLSAGALRLEPQLFVLDAGSTSDGAYAHEGEEFLYVLEGAVTVWIGTGEKHRLQPGDALTFPSTLPHRWRNRADGETRLLWINTPPTF
jgi:DNA-binding transcriptional MerR regulator